MVKSLSLVEISTRSMLWLQIGGEFLLSFANDLEEGNWWLVEGNDDYLAGYGELAFRDKKNGGPIQDYLEVLKKRTILKYKESLNPDTTTNIITTTQPV